MNGTETEQPKGPLTLRLGDSFDLPMGTQILLGRADTTAEGYLTYRVGALADNLKVSNFAVILENNQDRMYVGRPKFQFHGKNYESSNRIMVVKTDGKEVEVDDGPGFCYLNSVDLAEIRVGDKSAENGFMLVMDGKDKMKLEGIVNNKVQTKA